MARQKRELAILVADRITRGRPIPEIRAEFGLSDKRFRETLAYLAQNADEFGHIWSAFIVRAESAMQELSDLKDMAMFGGEPDLELARKCIIDRAAIAEAVTDKAVKVGLLNVAREKISRDVYLGKAARAALDVILGKQQEVDVALLEDHTDEDEPGNGHSDGPESV